DDGHDGYVYLLHQITRRRRTGDDSGVRAELDGALERRSHVGRGPRSGDANHEVFLTDIVIVHLVRAVLHDIFGTLLSAGQRRQPTRDDALYQLRVRSKGRWNLARIEHTESSGSASANVE